LSDPVAFAAGVAAAWHAAWLEALGLRSERDARVWRSLDTPPVIYWTAITLTSEAAADDLRDMRGTVCDSWSAIDLASDGFTVWAEEPWYVRPPGPLTDDEFAQMRTHPRLGYDAIVNAEALSLIEDEEIVGLAKEMVFTHHEWWDGHGYPRGLAGEDIPVGGRILAVVDVYDALIAARPYRGALRHEQAVDIILEQRGTHFDPDVVDAFVAAEREIEALSKTLAA